MGKIWFFSDFLNIFFIDPLSVGPKSEAQGRMYDRTKRNLQFEVHQPFSWEETPEDWVVPWGRGWTQLYPGTFYSINQLTTWIYDMLFWHLHVCTTAQWQLWNFIERQMKLNRFLLQNKHPKGIFWYLVRLFESEPSKIGSFGGLESISEAKYQLNPP